MGERTGPGVDRRIEPVGATVTRLTPDELRASLQASANRTRDTADEIARGLGSLGGVDDPMHPWPIPNEWGNWRGFTAKVARPLIEAIDAENEPEVQRLMVEFRRACPYYLAVCLVMADNAMQP